MQFFTKHLKILKFFLFFDYFTFFLTYFLNSNKIFCHFLLLLANSCVGKLIKELTYKFKELNKKLDNINMSKGRNNKKKVV